MRKKQLKSNNMQVGEMEAGKREGGGKEVRRREKRKGRERRRGREKGKSGMQISHRTFTAPSVEVAKPFPSFTF